ncbi:MAG: biotin--[acetyl-CoA-carboxylase] ligase [Alphaproteobacteria bacterium]|nr:MAG: biotin--[acetyl-CoA-carboxylase] ligase [Alphaproteobacteria bacterium]
MTAGIGTAVRCLAFAELDSTNAEARRRAEAGERGPLWIRADRQTAGRGRRGRRWVSEAGNLHATLLFSPAGAVRDRAQLSFVAVLAAHAALARLVDAPRRLRCKWPNDLLVDGRKLAGILLEGETDWLAIGFGINLAHHPEGLEQPATSLSAAFGVTVNPETVLDALAAAFDTIHGRWLAAGFAPIRAAWTERAAGLGEPVAVRVGREAIRGILRGLDEDGALRIERPDGTCRRIAAGDVILGGEG